MRVSRFSLDSLLEGLPGGDAPVLLEDRGLVLARQLGLDVPEHRVVQPEVDGTGQGVLDEILEIPGPRLVVKVLSPVIPHRTELDGVAVVSRRREDLRRVLEEWSRRFRWANPRILVAEYMPPDEHACEVLLGYRTTAEFGPVLTVAPGGVAAEMLSASLRPDQGPLLLTPGSVARLGPAGIRRLLEGRAFLAPLVAGVRGREPALEPDRLVALVESLALLAAEGSAAGLREFEVNPVRVSGGRAVALDALGRADPPWLRRRRGDRHPDAGDRAPRIRDLLRPRRIAVAGVSSSSMNPGRVILQNVLEAGFPRDSLTVVKEGATEVDGVRCVPTVSHLDPPVDLLVVGVPADAVPAMVAEAAAGAHARSLILISGGLEEGLDPGDDRPAERVREALASGPDRPVVAVGSNCLGIRSLPGRYDTLFIPSWKLGCPDRPPDPVAIVSQSGAFAIARASTGAVLNPRYVVTLGTQVDVTVGEMLEHLLEDPVLHTAACYVEGFRPGDGTRFLEAARSWGEAGRRVILYRGGRSPAGRDAAASHTASLAGDYSVTRALAGLAGVTVTPTVEAFQDQLLLSSLLGGRPAGRRVAVLSNAGFECVSMADHAVGLEWAELTPATLAGLREILARAGLEGIVAPRNPLDVTPILGDAGFAEAAAHLMEDPTVDAAVVSCVPLTPALQTLAAGDAHPEDMGRPGALADRLRALWSETTKPWVVAVDAGPEFDAFRRTLLDAGIPVLPTADRAVRALGSWLTPSVPPPGVHPERPGPTRAGSVSSRN